MKGEQLRSVLNSSLAKKTLNWESKINLKMDFVRQWIISEVISNDMSNTHSGKVYAVILGGGKGTRFWPLSRDLAPKQLLKIVGDKSMLKQTISRIAPIIPQENICVAANEFLTNEIKNHLHPEAEGINFFVEPEGKNTAPAIGLAAIYVKKMADDPVMILLPADHFIEKEEQFVEILKQGVDLSLEGYIVTIG